MLICFRDSDRNTCFSKIANKCYYLVDIKIRVLLLKEGAVSGKYFVHQNTCWCGRNWIAYNQYISLFWRINKCFYALSNYFDYIFEEFIFSNYKKISRQVFILWINQYDFVCILLVIEYKSNFHTKYLSFPHTSVVFKGSLRH